LREHLHRHIVRDRVRLHQTRDEIKLRRTGAREADLNLLHANFDELIEKPAFLNSVHRVDNRLVAIAKIGRQPARRRCDRLRRPLSIRQVDLRKRAVLAGWL